MWLNLILWYCISAKQSNLISDCPNFVLGENPCRFSAFGRNFLISCSDQILRGCKRSIFCPSSKIDPNQHFLLSILAQRDVLALGSRPRDSIFAFKQNSFITGFEDFVVLCDRFCQADVETVVFPEILRQSVVNPKKLNTEKLIDFLGQAKTEVACLNSFEKGARFLDIDCRSKIAEISRVAC